MKLKRLELFGFKSFGQKTELVFQEGITAIVGPNGCGKSNIVDSFRWVLGEQSIKSLRGNRTEDVIFNGTSQRKPLGMASVSMTFDNEDGALNLEFKEVTITRRLYRTGESEYLINKAPARLKDIVELFLDTGIGKEAYSIISQGRIDTIISNRPGERRHIFEDAAGISKYKHRKREAERRLLETEHNVLRIGDIIAENKEQLLPLEEQAAKAREYLALKDSLDKLVTGLLFYEGKLLEKRLAKLTSNLAAERDNILKETGFLQEKENLLTTLKWKLEKTREHLQEKQNRVYDISGNREKIHGELELAKEKINSNEARLCRNEEEKTKIAAGIDNLYKLQIDLRRKKDKLTQEVAAIRLTLKQIEERGQALNKEIGVTKVSDLQKRWEKLQKEKFQKAASLDSAAERKQHLQEKLLELEAQINSMLLIADRIKTELEIKEKKLSTMQAETAGQSREIEKIRQERDSLLATISQKEELLRKLKEESRATAENCKILQELESSFAGYFQGVRSVLQAKARGESRCQGIHGTVADLLEVSSDYRLAIETALGSSLQNLVAEDEKAVQEAIAFLKEKRLGRATFLPLTVIRGKTLEEDQIKADIVGLGVKLIRFESRYQAIMQYLLGRVLVCEHLPAAQKAARLTSFKFKIVSLQGEVIFAGGAVAGGYNRKKETFLLSRKQEIEVLRQKQEDLVKRLNALADELVALKTKEQYLSEKMQKSIAKKENLQANLLYKEKEAGNNKTELKTIISRLDDRKQAQKTLLVELKEISRKEKKWQSELTLCYANLAKSEEKLKASKEKLAVGQDALVALQEEVTRAKVKLASREENLKSVAEKLAEVVEKEAEQRIVLDKINQETKFLQSENISLQKEIEDREAKIAEVESKKRSLVKELTVLQSEQSDINAEILSSEQETEQARQNLQALKRKEAKLEIQKATLDTEFAILCGKLQDDFKLDFAADFPPEALSLSKKDTAGEIEICKEKLALLGDVNTGSIEELARVQKRLDFLEEQKEDLLSAQQTLAKIIAEIDVKMSTKFQETFNLLAHKFSTVFQSLFGGGTAFLKLVDKDNPLESGIDIIAKPPGKKQQHISLLSSGEKALTAIALLFAFLLVKPVPFCLLDEIDVSLDDSNLEKFSNFLKEMSKKIQFIMITHRKQAMAVADTLYGVTMEEAGISRMISMRFKGKGEIIAN